MSLEETKGDSVEKESASLPNINEKASVKRDAEEKATNNAEKKAHSTTYFGPDGKERTFIQARERRLALDRDVGKRKIITDSSKESEAGGFWCDVCKCSLKDNRAWLDHINGRKHQQHLGNVMRVERVDTQAVKDKFASLKNNKTKISAKDLYLKKREEERKRLEEQQQKQKEDEDEEDEETKKMREMMGFAAFSNTKKKYNVS